MTTYAHNDRRPEWLNEKCLGTILTPECAASLPVGSYVVRNLTEVYRIALMGARRVPADDQGYLDAATLALPRADELTSSLRLLSAPGLHLTALELDGLPVGATVTDNDRYRWLRVEVPVEGADFTVPGWVWVYDHSARESHNHTDEAMPYTSKSLVEKWGPVSGDSLPPNAYRAPGLIEGHLSRADGEVVAGVDDVRPYANIEARTVRLTARIDDPTGQVTKLLAGGVDPGEVSTGVSFDEATDPGDPDTADNSLDLDDLYRATSGTVVVDSDGDLWRRQVTEGGSKVWVIVVEGGVACTGSAMAATSERLYRSFGPIAFASADDTKYALGLIPRDIEGVLGGAEPAPAADPDAVAVDPDAPAALDADAVVERALDLVRSLLTGDGEHVEATITRDRDGKVRVRTAVDEAIEQS